jgi:hypothetical protein
MPYDRFLIAPFQTGLETDLRPFLIPEDAFAQLNNAYVFRGRVRKRFGSYLMGVGALTTQTAQLLSRLRIQVATTDVTGDAAGTVPGSIFKVGQAFSIGTEIFTVQALGTPITMLDTGSAAVKHYDTTTGDFTFVGAAALTPVYFYPGEPVMGLTNYEFGPINNQPSYGFDTQFAYKFTNNTSGWNRSGTLLFHDPTLTASNFVWAVNWEGVLTNDVTLFVTNFQVADPNGAGVVTDDPIWDTEDGTNWQPFSYSPDATINPTNIQPFTVTRTTTGNNAIIASFVQTARIIVPFKNRLLLLNTIENNANGAKVSDPANPTTTGITPATYLTSTNSAYPNRVRFSHNGSPFATNAWLEPNQTYNPASTGVVNADGGDYRDATTEEQIVGVEFIKDRLIVYFERSTWELVYTANEADPFYWQRLNTELGSEATFSTVPFDKIILTIGNTGVHGCNGSNVERIDQKIPQQVFQIKNKNQGVERVAGVRDYFTEMVYWTFPSDQGQATQIFPNRILVYNYQNGSWSFNNDCITTWGYYEQQQDTTWASSAPETWEDIDASWDSGVLQAQFRQVIAGNQEGFTFIIDADENRNAPAMQLTNVVQSGTAVILTIVNHTLNTGEYIDIENAVNGVANGIYQVTYVTNDTVSIVAPFTTMYTGGASITRVSNYGIYSKQWNPYLNEGYNFYLAKIDFGVLKTEDGQVTVDYYPSATNVSMIQAGQQTGAIVGTGVLETSPYNPLYYPLEQEQTRLWHPIYFQTDGECIQIVIFMSDAQIRNEDIAFSGFELEAMVLSTQRTRARLE